MRDHFLESRRLYQASRSARWKGNRRFLSLPLCLSSEHKTKITDRRNIPGSTSFVPPVAGTLIAYPVAKDLMETKEAPENQREDNPFVKDKRPSAHNLWPSAKPNNSLLKRVCIYALDNKLLVKNFLD